MKRSLSILIAAALVAAAIVAPAADAVAKKKKKKKSPPVVACAPYAPGELGADKPIVTVTDAHTAEAPLEQTVEVAESLADARILAEIPEAGPLAASYAHFNVQVDSANTDAGLYVSVEFDARHDYDLGLLHADASYAARSRAWNTVKGTPAEPVISADGHGGEPTDHSETIAGVRTADCAGYTAEFANYLGAGGEFAIKLWLGEGKYEPQAEGEEPR